MYKKLLISNIDEIHTTPMGAKRIAKNLNLDENNILNYCKAKILKNECTVLKRGKNFYCKCGNEVITINSYSYTIITAHVVCW